MSLIGSRRPSHLNGLGAELWAATLVVLMLAPTPWLFSGVDQTITGMTAVRSYYLLFKTILIAFWLPWLWSPRRVLDFQRIAPAATPLAVFIAVALLSLSWSSAPYVTARAVFELLLSVAFALALVRKFGSTRVSIVLAMAGGIFVIFSLIVVATMPQHAIHGLGDALHASHHGRWRGIYLHKNIFGHVSACFTLVAVYFAFLGTAWRPASLIVLATCLIFLYFAESATAWFMLFAGVSTFGLLMFEGRLRTLLLCTAMVGFSLVALAGGNLASFVGLFGRDGTLTGRISIWQRTIDNIGDGWLLGSGYANVTALGEYLSGAVTLTARDAHNGFLELWATLGLAGTSVFLTVVGFALRDVLLRAGPREHSSMLSSALFMAWLSASMTEASPVRPGTGLFLIFAISILALAAAQRPRYTGARS